MQYTTFHTILTVVMLIAFVVLIFWVMSGKQKQDFERAARIPLEDDDMIIKRDTNASSLARGQD